VRRPGPLHADGGHTGGVQAARGLRGALAARHGDKPAEQQGDVGGNDGPAQIGSQSIRLTAASAPLTREIEVRDEFGATRTISIPAERALTVFVDRRELVTLMTLGAAPELLVVGYLRNQRLVDRPDDIESVTVDWDVNAAAVKTRAGIERFDEKTAKRVVTTGCGQGTVFGDLMGEIGSIRLAAANDPSARLSQATLYRLLDAVRRQESTYKSAGSVHGCALFCQDELLMFVEDVGRHNAIDTIAGWMWLNDVGGDDKIFYTTGRLTSEMVMKSAQIGVPIVVSRSGITQMGLEIAERLGLALFGRATNRHFICYCGFDRFDAAPEPPRG
jgi:FdhD protein